MKSIFYKSLALVAFLGAAASCTNDLEYTDVTPTPVTSFYEPANEKAVKLVPSNSASLFFEWEAAHVVSGAVPQYELAFYKADDTKTPIYKVVSDNNGAKPMATVTHKSLAKIMAAAGVGMGETGTIKWGVISYAGANSTPSTTLYDLTVTRFIGFNEIPDALYLVGAGTETGDDVSAARAFSKPDADYFEIFSKLTAGQKIYFSGDKEGLSTFCLNGNRINEGEEGTGVEATGVYRISLDFSTAKATLSKIDHVYMRFTDFDGFSAISGDGHLAFEFDYQGNGVYSKEATIKTKDTGWSWDPYESRYNIYMKYADGNNTSWAPTNTGIDAKPNMPLDITSSYWTMQEFPNTVGYKWKLSSSCYNVPCLISVYFNSEYGAYTHFTKAL